MYVSHIVPIRYLTQFYDKNGQSNNIKMQPKRSITQRLRTYLRRSVGVTTATKLVWFTGSSAQLSHSPKQPCNSKDQHEKTLIDNKQFNINKHVSTI